MKDKLLLGVAMAALATAPAFAQTWTAATAPSSIGATAQALLTDGTVIVQNIETSNWYRLTPDNTGSYVHGTWAAIASMPTGYAPLYDASEVLPDGRFIVNGGEYNGTGGGGVWTTKGAIYDPVANKWTAITPPAGWSTIGDAQSVIMPNGTYMLANCCTSQAATIDPKTLKFTAATTTGKADINDEEGWTLLPDGSILTVDANNTADLKHTERYVNGAWQFAGDTISELPDLQANGSGSHEMGPHVLRPDGTVFCAGATGHTGIFNTKTMTWSAGPDFPMNGGQLDSADGPGALEPSGHVLLGVSPGVFNTPVSFFEWTGKRLKPIAGYSGTSQLTSYQLHFLVLPNGQIMTTDFSSTIQFFTPKGTADKSSVPVIKSIASTLKRGSNYTLTGVGLNGKSQGAAYGDDFQANTNFPLVRITNTGTGHVFYARTSGFSSMAVANPNPVTANVVVPSGVETGASTLVAVANGIASAPVSVTIQ